MKKMVFKIVKFIFTFIIIFAIVFTALNWQALYLRFFWSAPDNQEIEQSVNLISFLEEKIANENYEIEEKENTENLIKEKEKSAGSNSESSVSKREEKENQNLEEICRDSCLVIPKIGVVAPIIFSQSKLEKNIQNDLKSGVAHYAGTSMPGETGNCFITGHSSNYIWRGGTYNTVFIFLDKLENKDEIFAYYNKKIYKYEVIGKKLISPEQVEILKGGDDSILSLMTCWPAGTNLKRLVIQARLK
jgi:sortase A